MKRIRKAGFPADERETDNISRKKMEEDPYMKKMLSVLLAAMMLIGLLAAPAPTTRC